MYPSRQPATTPPAARRHKKPRAVRMQGKTGAPLEYNMQMDCLAQHGNNSQHTWQQRFEALRMEETKRDEESRQRHQQLLELLTARNKLRSSIPVTQHNAREKNPTVQALIKEKEQIPIPTSANKRVSALINSVTEQPTAAKGVEQQCGDQGFSVRMYSVISVHLLPLVVVAIAGNVP